MDTLQPRLHIPKKCLTWPKKVTEAIVKTEYKISTKFAPVLHWKWWQLFLSYETYRLYHKTTLTPVLNTVPSVRPSIREPIQTAWPLWWPLICRLTSSFIRSFCLTEAIQLKSTRAFQHCATHRMQQNKSCLVSFFGFGFWGFFPKCSYGCLQVRGLQSLHAWTDSLPRPTFYIKLCIQEHPSPLNDTTCEYFTKDIQWLLD